MRRVRPDRASEFDADNSPFHIAVRFGDAPELHLFLQRNRPTPVPAPHPHLAMYVAPETLDTFVERLRAASVPLDGPRRLGPPGHASVYFADPFGNTLELVTLGYLWCGARRCAGRQQAGLATAVVQPRPGSEGC